MMIRRIKTEESMTKTCSSATLSNFHTRSPRNEPETMAWLKNSMFWDITPCSPLKVNRRFVLTCRLHLHGRRISQTENQLCWLPAFALLSCSAYSLTLEMEATCSSKTSVEFQRTTRRYTPEDGTLHNHHCENLKSYMAWLSEGNQHGGSRALLEQQMSLSQ
jgi:hypothetical protein